MKKKKKKKKSFDFRAIDLYIFVKMSVIWGRLSTHIDINIYLDAKTLWLPSFHSLVSETSLNIKQFDLLSLRQCVKRMYGFSVTVVSGIEKYAT